MRTKRRYDKVVSDLLEKHEELLNAEEIVDRMFVEYNTLESQYIDEETKEQLRHKAELARESSQYNSVVKNNKSKKKSVIRKKHLTKMYRRIVSHTHPDKMEQLGVPEVERYNRESIFKDVVPAYKKLNVPLFFECANETSILPNSIGQMGFFSDALEIEIRILGEKIDALKQTVAWSLYECGDDVQCRERLVKQTAESIYK